MESNHVNGPFGPRSGSEPTVLHSRSLADLASVQADLVGRDGALADLFLRFIHQTAEARHDGARLLSTITDFTFSAFPQATHVVLAFQEDGDEELSTVLARSRSGETPSVALSRTLVHRVMSEGVSLLFSDGDSTVRATRSLVFSGIRTALCAPLSSVQIPFGIIQLDIRESGNGNFTRRDLDLLTVFAHHVALVLDNLRLHQEQTRALVSTINALVHSLSLKDPDTALHSERVQSISILIGEEMGLPEAALEAVGMAAILHDMGKQGIRDEVLNKPGVLNHGERREMSGHAGLTENVLDKIFYPAHLKQVPLLAAYHHEKMDGSGPYGLKGEEIPIEARVISVADVFDALISARVYKKALPLGQALQLLRKGRDKHWDVNVIDTLERSLPRIMALVYGRSVEAEDLEPPAEAAA